jgi:hypothetical protein
VVPAEALLEAEPGDWWTLGRRVRLGRAASPLLDAGSRRRFVFGSLPAPYDHLSDEVDGRSVFTAGVLAGHAVWSEVPSPVTDRWSPSDLNYRASFEAGGTTLRTPGHDGGDVDWYTVDGDPGAVARTRVNDAEPPTRQVIPGRLDYPGAPNPRWWQLEDRAVDIGGFAPGRHGPRQLRRGVATEPSVRVWAECLVDVPHDRPPGNAAAGVAGGRRSSNRNGA